MHFPKIPHQEPSSRRVGRPCLALVQGQTPARWTVGQGVIRLSRQGWLTCQTCLMLLYQKRKARRRNSPSFCERKALVGVQTASREGPRTPAGPLDPLSLCLLPVLCPSVFSVRVLCPRVTDAPGLLLVGAQASPIPHLGGSTHGKARGSYQGTFPFGCTEGWKGAAFDTEGAAGLRGPWKPGFIVCLSSIPA